MAHRITTALMFPGQGSQVPGMRDSVAEHCPELLEIAFSSLGECPFEQIDKGTRYAQPAVYCAALAGWIAAGRPEFDYDDLMKRLSYARSGGVFSRDELNER